MASSALLPPSSLAPWPRASLACWAGSAASSLPHYVLALWTPELLNPILRLSPDSSFFQLFVLLDFVR